MSGSSISVLALTLLGGLITLLGLFAAGDVAVMALGLGAIAAAGLIGALERFATRPGSAAGVESGAVDGGRT